jgi:hypothetical protein
MPTVNNRGRPLFGLVLQPLRILRTQPTERQSSPATHAARAPLEERDTESPLELAHSVDQRPLGCGWSG